MCKYKIGKERKVGRGMDRVNEYENTKRRKGNEEKGNEDGG